MDIKEGSVLQKLHRETERRGLGKLHREIGEEYSPSARASFQHRLITIFEFIKIHHQGNRSE